MKKVIFPLCFIVLMSIGLFSINSFPYLDTLSNVFNFNEGVVMEYDMKYSDCISETDFSQFSAPNLKETLQDTSVHVKEMNRFLDAYKNTLDATVKNLNAIDCHEFLHNEYERCSKEIRENPQSDIKIYYHLAIMKMCYEKDKSLNLDSGKKLVISQIKKRTE